MPVGKEDFEAGVYSDALHRVMECLQYDHALSYFEIRQQTGLYGQPLDDALIQLEALGLIHSKQLKDVMHYLKLQKATQQQWFTVDEAAQYLRVSRRTIYQLVREGELVSYRVGEAGHKRFKREDLDRAMHKEDIVELYAMTAAGDPVLAELWDNEKDAAYDQI